MPANYVLLEKIVVGAAGATTVVFSNIPQTGYTDLVLKMSARTLYAGGADAYVRFNASSNYYWKKLQGIGTSASSYGGTNTGDASPWTLDGTFTANTFSNSEIYIPNYAGSTFKSFSGDSVAENNAAATYTTLTANLWQQTTAISEITLSVAVGFSANSTFYLYGVAKLGTSPAIAPKATGGDVIMTDGTYWYHAFRSSGTFTPANALTCDYLVVAGGGGGGQVAFGGGGGAGGLRSTVTATGGGGSLESALSLTGGTGYTVTIGAGGAQSTQGSNSVFSTITSTAGGGGGFYYQTLPDTGGSGGGGGGNDTVLTRAGAAGTANQGFAGGNGATTVGVAYCAGGGGGAGAVGANAVQDTNGGAGGAGVAISAFATATGTGVSNYYAGGGGGSDQASAPGGPGAGGAGGGGGGGDGTTPGAAGTANTGGGGGGAGNGGGAAGGAGGSGIVIVRYAV